VPASDGPGGKHARIFAVVRRIPRGRVASYGQVARLAGLPGHARLVGYALHACPSNLPWQRVVNVRGEVSLPEADGQAAFQRALLEAEGVIFRDGRVDMGRFGWRPRGERGTARPSGGASRKGGRRRP
jgi:methylated-DNA-protein-cysteine methyltransferase-like protein